MKKAIILISLVLSLFRFSALAHAQDWEWQNPYPCGNRVYSMAFIDSLTIWFGSCTGTVWHSTDGGETWDIQYTQIPDLWCSALCFINPNEGWLGGHESNREAYILHTLDGGNNWEVQYVDSVNQKFSAITFLNDKYGWAGTEGKAQIYYTKNGGETWNLSDFQPLYHSSKVTSIVFLDSLKGFADGEGMRFMKTLDGGKTWQNADIGGHVGWKVFFSDSLHGWLTSNGTVLRTTDGGESWLDDLPVFTDAQITDIFFADTLYGWVAGWEEGIFRTSDGGWTWEKVCSYYSRIEYGGMVFFTPSSGWIDFNRTWDGGLTLHPQKKGLIVTSFQGVDFIDSQIGWIVSGDGVIAKTTNGGTDWLVQDNQYRTGFQDVFALDENYIWAVGWTGRIYSSANGGETWHVHTYSMGTDSRHTGVAFVDSTNGWIVGGNFYIGGWILRTTDGGATWNEITPYPMPRLFDVTFLNADTGFVVSGGGTTSDIGAIYKTTDGGDTWTQKFQHMNGLESICFINESMGWAGGYHLIVKTTDSGESWEVINEKISLNSLFFVDEEYGWTCTVMGYVYHTTDSGITWERQYTGTRETLYDVYFTDRYTGWLVGHNASILKTTSGGTLVTDPVHDTQENECDFQIRSNYPNPFNQVTRIPFRLTNRKQVRVTVFDLLGKEVITLIDGVLEPGSYEVVWDGKNRKGGDLPSGIYVCTISAGGIHQKTLKMVLVK
jgi:photosystem II stability/assembly factor-like uncharacterized protein